MEGVAFSTTTFLNTTPNPSVKLPETPLHIFTLFPVTLKLNPKNNSNTRSYAFNRDNHLFALSSSSSSSVESLSIRRNATSTASTASTLTTSSSVKNHHWMVVMEPPQEGVNSKPEIVDYFVKTLQNVLGSEKDAQMSIYHASSDTHFGFCCDIDEEISRELAGLPGVLAVRPDPNYGAMEKDYRNSEVQLGYLSNTSTRSALLFPAGNTKLWLVSVDKPALAVVTKPQIVDYYTQVLSKVMGNETDAQMCIYHVSWQSNFGFCCELDEECARELAGVPGVLSVRPIENFEHANEDRGGENLPQFSNSLDSSASNGTTDIKTKKLFVTGLSFYTSEKTLRAAFEGFGEVVEVKIIMDKISKRSKGYGFVEYTTEAAAGVALKEMNGKIINGWMITVDVAKSKPPNYSRSRARPAV
ncbi:organelle RRM domain-containing protein 1, chloroplastic [Diospyros lotus]|uniref:organelle RRM domain-containing protein 1, chloroplastic n=1 Tax=Diospyros lotus TaxID=55363 RepID=UPI0022533FDC|nr:organelle RRM domain-containing protein 1, chloroplastic [Diospyros lotus]